MKRICKHILRVCALAVTLVLSGVSATAQNDQEVQPTEQTKAAEHDSEGFTAEQMPEMIGHHIGNSHQWDIFGWKGDNGEEKVLSIPLPVMAVHDGNFLFCMSSSLSDGKTISKDGLEWSMHHGKLKVKDGGELVDPTLDFSFTRNVASMWMSVAIILLIFVGLAKSYRKSSVPKGFNNAVEMMVLFVKDIADEQIGKQKSGKFTPYLLTLFFFIWINNLIGLIPVFPGSSNLSGNISFTAVLAIFTFLITNICANKHYWHHNLTMPGVPFIMKFILVPVEIISIFTKPFTLLIRLFANVTGGHIIIISLMSLILLKGYGMVAPSMILTLVIFVLELIFGILQAYIFTLLSALYIGLAVNQEGHKH